MKKEYRKTVKILKQGALCVTIPKVICDVYNLKQGDELDFVLELGTGNLRLELKEEQDNEISNTSR